MTDAQDYFRDEKRGVADLDKDREEKVGQKVEDVSSTTNHTGTTGPLKRHPSRNLGPRAKGYGIGGGYERPYKKERAGSKDTRKHLYGPLPHAGYYGTGSAERPFGEGQASFSNEIELFHKQYGERTSGFEDEK
jgi:hypothetical protein